MAYEISMEGTIWNTIHFSSSEIHTRKQWHIYCAQKKKRTIRSTTPFATYTKKRKWKYFADFFLLKKRVFQGGEHSLRKGKTEWKDGRMRSEQGGESKFRQSSLFILSANLLQSWKWRSFLVLYFFFLTDPVLRAFSEPWLTSRTRRALQLPNIAHSTDSFFCYNSNHNYQFLGTYCASMASLKTYLYVSNFIVREATRT